MDAPVPDPPVLDAALVVENHVSDVVMVNSIEPLIHVVGGELVVLADHAAGQFLGNSSDHSMVVPAIPPGFERVVVVNVNNRILFFHSLPSCISHSPF